MTVDFVGEFERSSASLGDIDSVLLIWFEVPVGVRVFGVGLDFGCCERALVWKLDMIVQER